MTPRSPAQPEPFDLQKLRAEQARQRAEQAAYQWSYVPPLVRAHLARPIPAQPPPLALYLDPLVPGRPWRGPAFPPPDLIGEYDPALEGLIHETDRAYAQAWSAAFEWEKLEPGGPGFAALLDADDGQVIEHLARGRHRGWVAAFRAQQAARMAEAEVRAYAVAAVGLIATLAQARDAIGDGMRVRLEKARDDKSRRDYDAALDLTHEWRTLNNLIGWLQHPSLPWREPVGTAWPQELATLEWEADAAVTGKPRPEVPGLEGTLAPDGKMVTSTGEPVNQPKRRGLFGRG